MALVLPELPYQRDELAPTISGETIDYHYGKHHNAYVTNLNRLVEGTELRERSLEEIVAESDGVLFNNAAQVWNHTFYWNCLSPQGGGSPEGLLLKALERDFGSYEAFREAFVKAATTLFGSGWTWLVLNGEKLEITQTANADLPLRHGRIPLFTVDVWEHAYYVDYRNERPRYVNSLLEELANWRFVEENLSKAI